VLEIHAQNGAVWCFIFLSKLQLHGAEPFLRSHQLCSYSRITQHCMEPGGSLPCSQGPSSGPYREPDQSSPYHPIVSRRSILIHSYLRLGHPSGLSTTKILYVCYISCPSHPWCDHSNYTSRRVQVMKLLMMQFSSTTCHFIPLRSE
jgi:hypothetical protein